MARPRRVGARIAWYHADNIRFAGTRRLCTCRRAASRFHTSRRSNASAEDSWNALHCRRRRTPWIPPRWRCSGCRQASGDTQSRIRIAWYPHKRFHFSEMRYTRRPAQVALEVRTSRRRRKRTPLSLVSCSSCDPRRCPRLCNFRRLCARQSTYTRWCISRKRSNRRHGSATQGRTAGHACRALQVRVGLRSARTVQSQTSPGHSDKLRPYRKKAGGTIDGWR